MRHRSKISVAGRQCLWDKVPWKRQRPGPAGLAGRRGVWASVGRGAVLVGFKPGVSKLVNTFVSEHSHGHSFTCYLRLLSPHRGRGERLPQTWPSCTEKHSLLCGPFTEKSCRPLFCTSGVRDQAYILPRFWLLVGNVLTQRQPCCHFSLCFHFSLPSAPS